MTTTGDQEKSTAGRRHRKETGYSVAGAGPHVLPDAGGGSGWGRGGAGDLF